MSNRDGFNGGFWLGTLVGGVVGGIVGVTIAERRANRLEDDDRTRLSGDGDKRPLKSSRSRRMDRMEMARRSLDDKINDLNNAIDSVRSSISPVPGEPNDRQNEDPEASNKAQHPLDPQS